MPADRSPSHLQIASDWTLARASARLRGMAAPRRSPCPVSRTLDVLGDRWTLLVVRDLLRGKHRFGDMLASKEAIPTNLLADRLRRLKAKGIIRARRYSSSPPRVEYFLTQKGEDLRPVVRAMVDWGVRHAGGRVPPGYVATPPNPP
jgi:DNA-binding HxlR family transcriptional regulator